MTNHTNRFAGIRRDYTPDDVASCRARSRSSTRSPGSAPSACGACCTSGRSCARLGALTGNQALQQVKAGLEAIYLSGWQVAADANNAGEMYPDQSLYPASSVPEVVRRINKTLQRADQIAKLEGDTSTYWFAPIVADAEAGFGGPLNAFELMKAMIEAGAAGVHFEDQLASEKKCGHLGGKVLVPTQTFIRTLNAARLAADVCDVPTLVIARTDAHSATLITSDIDERDAQWISGERTGEGFYPPQAGQHALGRRTPSRAASPMRPMPTWCGGRPPSPISARRASSPPKCTGSIPGKLMAYNCSPSFNWRAKLDDKTIARFQEELAAMGYRFQFVTLAGFHALNLGMFELASDYRDARHGGLLGAAAARVRGAGPRLHRRPPPARGRHRLLRRRGHGGFRRHARRPWRWPDRPRPSSSRSRPWPRRTRRSPPKPWRDGGSHA